MSGKVLTHHYTQNEDSNVYAGINLDDNREDWQNMVKTDKMNAANMSKTTITEAVTVGEVAIVVQQS